MSFCGSYAYYAFPDFCVHLLCILICLLFNNGAFVLCLPHFAIAPQAFDVVRTSQRPASAKARSTPAQPKAAMYVCYMSVNGPATTSAFIRVSILVSLHQWIVEGRDAGHCGKGKCSFKPNSQRLVACSTRRCLRRLAFVC